MCVSTCLPVPELCLSCIHLTQVDELHAALAAKQEDCAAAVVRCAALQEQLSAANGALAAAQVQHGAGCIVSRFL